ncbi:hypothetical protein TanjilG_18779 [Lupinus angustifolius]|uniref:Uncharacterized protein n=1 Tax=Lupinus angustifolius TaxID=3871 RepID=A0A1J7GDL6_LUPAN|nr:PREDICTED: uncharacterized protein LOC109326036 isoform X1 [Lupinus angustifolius]OIV98495.1 hypothetical protein TanjilG_18779 [Lupinus angustifolius]
MGTAILIRSHDSLQSRLRNDAFSLTASSSKSQRNPNPSSGRSRRRTQPPVNTNSNDRDRSRNGIDRSTVVVKGPGSNLVMGQVKILKRGEKLPEIAKSDECFDSSVGSVSKIQESFDSNLGSVAEIGESFDLGLGSTDRLGPDPATVKNQIKVQKQIRVLDLKDGVYAGSNFDVASPPPSSVPVPIFLGKKNGASTSGLRRLLRLDSV